MVLFPAKHIGYKIWICFLSLSLCETGVGKSMAVKFRPSSVGKVVVLVTFVPVGGGNKEA